MKLTLSILGILLLVIGCVEKKSSRSQNEKSNSTEIKNSRYVEHNVFISDTLPVVKIMIDDEFEYEGSFDFEIIANTEYPLEMRGKSIASGDRYVFSTKSDSDITKLFIIQLEGFHANNEFKFNYNFDNANFIGKNKYRFNTWFYDSEKLAMENPSNEGAKTREFLTKKGYEVPDDFMMSRFVGLASEDRKNEIIIFYIEMMKQSIGYSLDEYENLVPSKRADSIRNAFIIRSNSSFQIVKG